MTNPAPSSALPKGQPLVATAAYYLSFIILGLVLSVQGPSLPALANQTLSGLDRISLIFVTGSLGYMLGSYAGGRLYDRLPGHRLMSLATLGLAATAALIPIVPHLWLLLLVMFFVGLANGVIDVGSNTLLQWVHGERVGPFMNGLHFFFGIGSTLAPLLLVGFVARAGSIHWTFWTISLTAMPLAAWLWVLPEPPHRSRAQARGGAFVPVLPVVLIVLCFFFYVGAEIGFGNWIYTYAVTLDLESTVNAGRLNSAFWGAFTLGRLLGVWISTRLRSQTILLVDLFGCLASLLLIMLSRDSTTVLWAGAILLGLFMASIFPTLLIFAGERMQVSGAITGWFLVGSGIGGMFLPWFIGQIFVAAGPATMMTSILAAVVLNLVIVLIVAGLPRAARPVTA